MNNLPISSWSHLTISSNQLLTNSRSGRVPDKHLPAHVALVHKPFLNTYWNTGCNLFKNTIQSMKEFSSLKCSSISSMGGHYMLPWSSAILVLGTPLRRCSPSMFWVTTNFTWFFSFWHQMIYSNDNMRIVHLIPFLSEQVLPKPCGWGWVWPEYHHWLFSFWFWPQSHLSYIVPGHIHARLQPLLFESPHTLGSPET